jgi:hypothetical protein
LSPSETVLNLKKRNSYHIGVPIDQFYLKSLSKLLNDESKKLSDYEIQDNNNIFVISTLRGGEDPDDFVDVENIEAMKHINGKKVQQNGNMFRKELILKENANCPIYSKIVIDKIGFGKFDLLKDIVHCLVCK